MRTLSTSRSSRAPTAPAGFTMVETLIVLVLLAVLAATAMPGITQMIAHARVQSAASVVAADLEIAFSLAARQRRPVRLAAGTLSYAITDRASGARLHRRVLDATTEFKLSDLSASASSIDIFPNGIASGPVTITLSSQGYTRRVMVTRLGQVRALP